MSGAPDLPLSLHPDGVVLAVRVMPRAGRTAIAGLRGAAVLIRLAAAPIDGAANEALVDLLARTCDLPRRRFSILTGATGRDKRILVRDASLDHVKAALLRVLVRGAI